MKATNLQQAFQQSIDLNDLAINLSSDLYAAVCEMKEKPFYLHYAHFEVLDKKNKDGDYVEQGFYQISYEKSDIFQQIEFGFNENEFLISNLFRTYRQIEKLKSGRLFQVLSSNFFNPINCIPVVENVVKRSNWRI